MNGKNAECKWSKRKDFKETLEKIIKSQLSDKIKKKKADFIINTSASKDWCFNKILKTIEQIKDK